MNGTKMKMVHLVIINAFLLIADGRNDETVLWKDIMDNGDYNKYMRKPTQNISEPIEVKIEIVLYTIHSLNMKDQIMTTSVGIMMSWTDEFLTWNSSLYGETNEISAPLSRIWNPDVCLVNSADKSTFFEENNKLVNIYRNGRVEWESLIELNTHCFVDTTRYPFEIENCKIEFSAQIHDNKEQVLRIRMQDNFLNQYQSNGEWHISNSDKIKTYTKIRKTNAKLFSRVGLHIEMDRRQTYYVWKFLVPSVAITFINIVTFWLPVKSGGKVALSTFVMLGFTAMIELFNESLPSSSDKISYFGRLLWWLLGISGIILIVNVIITSIFYRKCIICERVYSASSCEKEADDTNEDQDTTQLNTETSKLCSTCFSGKEEDKGNIELCGVKTQVTTISLPHSRSENEDDTGNLIEEIKNNKKEEDKNKTKEKEEIERRRKQKASKFDVFCFVVMFLPYGIAYAYFCNKIFGGRENVA